MSPPAEIQSYPQQSRKDAPMKLKTAALILTITMLFTGCGGGGCDAGKPGFGNVPYDCPAAASPPASSASSGG